ncbi:MAG: FHA domain-containing protein [Ktedonobacteraceae bacterium]
MQAALIGPSGHTFLGPAGLTIGRMQSNQYVVYDRRVSARHAVISYLKQGYFTITDIGSTNGTFVNGLLLVHNVPQILHSGDTICIGDTVLTFQLSDQFQNRPHANPSLNEHETTWDGSATDRFVRVRYQPNANYNPAESQEKQASIIPVYKENHRLLQSASVTPAQKVNEISASIKGERSYQTSLSPSTRSHRKIVLSVLLVSLVLLGVTAFSAFEYLNRSTPEKTLDDFCNALQSKDYVSMYEQLSNKVQQFGSEKLIAENMSNVNDCTYTISKESESMTSAKLTFIGLSGQRINGTIILIKDNNSTWKIADLENF